MEDTSNTRAGNEQNSKDDSRREVYIFKDLIPAKGYYLFQNFTLGCFIPFVYLFYLSIGLSITQAGIINGTRQIFAGTATFVIGFLIDYTGRKRPIMLAVILMNALLVISTPFTLYPLYSNKNYSMQNNLTMSKLNSTVSTRMQTPAAQSSLFVVVLFWFIILAITRFPLVAIIDSTVMNLVKASYQGKATFGMQRVFGPIGFTLGSLMSGFAMDLYKPTDGLSKFTIVFLIQIPVYLFMFLCAAVIKIVNTKKDDAENNIKFKEQKKTSILTTFYLNCKNIPFVMFLITLFISGLSFNIISNCLAIFLKEMNASKSMIGATISASSAAEIIIFPFSAKLIQLFGGTYKCLCIGILSYSLRFLIYFISTSPWHVFMAQILQSLGFGLFWAAAIEYTYSMTTSRVSQSMFSLVNMVFFMVSSVLANFAGGFLYDAIGGRYLFLSMAILCFLWWLVLIMFYVLVERHKSTRGHSVNY